MPFRPAAFGRLHTSSAVGDVLHSSEVEPMTALGNALDPLLDALLDAFGDVADSHYFDNPQWSDVVRGAKAARTALNANR